MTTLVSASTLDDVPEGKHVIHVLNETGDVRITWDPDRPNEVKSSKKQFDDLVKEGYRAFSVNKKGEKDAQIRELAQKFGLEHDEDHFVTTANVSGMHPHTVQPLAA